MSEDILKAVKKANIRFGEQVRQNDAREIAETLKRFNKDFSEEEVQKALRELINYGLLTG